MCFQQTGDLCPAQQNTDMTTDCLNKTSSFPSNVPQPAHDHDKSQAPVFTSTEPLSTIREQDIIVTSSFSLGTNSMLQQGAQQFLLKPTEVLRQESPSTACDAVGRLCREPSSQQQQLSLLPPDEVAQLEKAVRQLKAEGFCNLPLQSDNSMAKEQQQHIQHQQQIQKQQIQQQQHQIQQQQLQQQQQHHQVLENLQQQLFQSQLQCGMFQDAPQDKAIEQQGSTPGVLSNQGTLFQQAQQQQQQASLFQQASDLLSIQTNFIQQTPSHPSPPIFRNPTSLAETQDPQQVQAALFQNTMTVLQSPDQQPSTAGLFLPQTSLPSQLTTCGAQQQQQQIAFLSGPKSQSVFQSPTQLSPIQQGSPMAQQQTSQPPPLTQPAQQASLFQNISPCASSTNTLPPGQQQHQAGLLFCNNALSTPDQASSLMFSSQGQMPPLTSSSLVSQECQNPSHLFSQATIVAVNQQDRSEPMAIGNPTNPPQQVMFQEQQPMQLDSGSSNRQEQPVGLFMAQPSMASLQGGLAAQDLAQSAMFAPQNGVTSLQTTTSSPIQQPGTLYQTTVSGSISQPSQPQRPGLFVFGIQSGKNLIKYVHRLHFVDHINPASNLSSDDA